jgi:uncharacterized protein (DUF2236 family)
VKGSSALVPRLSAVPDPPTARDEAAASISWRVNAERVVLFGWGRAILLQLAHPLVAAGVFDHSGFRATSWAAATRLYHTVHAMLSLTFGDEVVRVRTLDHIRAIHRRVNGALPERLGPYPAGSRYSAEDPALVLWVHLTLVESVVLAYEQLVAPLDEAARDSYCLQAAPIAVALGAREVDVPGSWAQLREGLDRLYASDSLVVGSQARELAQAVLSPRGAWMAAPVMWLNREVTIGLLPASVRDLYGFRWTPRRERTYARLRSALRITRRYMPVVFALWPESRARRRP